MNMFSTKTYFHTALPESNPLILKDKHVVAYEDLERIVFSHVLDSVDNVDEMMRSVRKRSFCLEYELPLNKRFIDIFTEMAVLWQVLQ